MMGTTAAEPTAGNWHATCLIVPPSGEAPAPAAAVEQLASSLTRRGLSVIRSSGPHDAMADLVVHERRRRAQRAPEPLVVILVDAPRQPASAPLYLAALKHAPSTVFWEFCGGPNMRLTAYHPPAERAPEPELNLTPPPTPMVARGVSPARPPERQPLRLTHESEIEAIPLRIVSPPDENDARPPAGALLTDEELSMLLGEGPEEGWTGGTRA